LKAISSDTLELAVQRPPKTFDEALVLASEQCDFASDIADQGEHRTIGELAAALVGQSALALLVGRDVAVLRSFPLTQSPRERALRAHPPRSGRIRL